MKKVWIQICLLLSAATLLIGCYKDLGNYDYSAINELEITGLESRYEVDQDEMLEISPQLTGTKYQDTTRFSYAWEVSRNIINKYKDLKVKVSIGIGEHFARFIVTDNQTGAKAYFNFTLRVSSTTAGDLIMVLSKQDGRAELSYKRLDKEADFVTNYYEKRYDKVLGIDPIGIAVNYNYLDLHIPFSYASTRGGLQLLFKDQWKVLNKNDLGPNEGLEYITGSTFSAFVPPYPIPDISNFKPTYLNYQIYMWNYNPYGNVNQTGRLMTISNGALYSSFFDKDRKAVSINQKAQDDGYLSSAMCYAYVVNEPQPTGGSKPTTLVMKGYSVSENILLFDEVNGRFMYSSAGSGPRLISTKEDGEYLPFFKGYKMLYATHTANPGKCMVVLSNGEHTKLLYMFVPSNATQAKTSPFAIEGEVNVSTEFINAKTKFYALHFSPYVLFNTADKVYRYNVLNIMNKQQPDQVIVDLSALGYNADASIQSFTVSRAEKNLLIAVSRYGQDNQGSGTVLKGDVLKMLFNSSSIEAQLDKKFEAVSGFPVDIQIKYQNFFRDGLDKENKLVDKI